MISATPRSRLRTERSARGFVGIIATGRVSPASELR
jgi:hypothetical protein